MTPEPYPGLGTPQSAEWVAPVATIALSAEEVAVVRDTPFFHAIVVTFDEFGTIRWFEELEPPAYGPTLRPRSTVRQQLDRLEPARLILDRWITVFKHLEHDRLPCEGWLIDFIREEAEETAADIEPGRNEDWIRPVEVMRDLAARMERAAKKSANSTETAANA